MKVAERTVVTMEYTVRDSDGAMIDSSAEGDGPLSFVFGRGEILPGLEKALEGHETGDTLSVTLAPADAYGEKVDGSEAKIPRDQFPQELDIVPGMMLMMETEDGQVPFTVIAVSDDVVNVDFAHPLAGRTLQFDVRIVDVREATIEELMNTKSCGCGDSSCSDDCSSGCC